MKKIVLQAAFLIFLQTLMFSQDFRFGFQVSPNRTWINSSDNTINATGGNTGLKLGVVGEFYFDERYAVTAGLGFAFNQGGTLKHDRGGNFFIESDLSNPLLNEGDKPLPDGVELTYKIQYVEIPVGLKMRTDEMGYFRYFAEIPIFPTAVRTQARGNIEGTGISVEDLDINKDVTFFSFSWGLGAGVEYSISSNTAIVAGLYFQNQLIDFTDNSAIIATDQTAGADTPMDLSDDEWTTIKEDASSKIGSITLRLGVLF